MSDSARPSRQPAGEAVPVPGQPPDTQKLKPQRNPAVDGVIDFTGGTMGTVLVIIKLT